VTDTAARDLHTIRTQWGDLLAAIGQPPRTDWPPRQPSEQHLTREDAGTDTGPQVGRLPLTLRQHPAPVNLTALDAALSIETELFALADRIAAAIQRPVKMLVTTPQDKADATDADRWHYAGLRHLDRRSPVATAGSRALGLHWCAVWIEDRLAQTEPTDLHGVVRGVLREHAERVTAEAHATLARALGRDGRDTVLADPCPWCHGQLTARTTSGDPMAAVVTCGTGPTCTAPTVYDGEARRVWRGHLLGQLYGALSAARSNETAA
jgi:hypothetical protein